MKLLLIILTALTLISCNDSKKEEDQNTINDMETGSKKPNVTIASDNNFGQATMLIRKPVSEVFDAFINPEMTTKFWFSKSTGKLEEGKSVAWIWEMYNLSVPVKVTKIITNELIQIEWGEGSNLSSVAWRFKAIEEDKTFVTITNAGLQGKGDELINAVRDSTSGFTIVLAGLKAFLEYGIQLNLIQDKYPKQKS